MITGSLTPALVSLTRASEDVSNLCFEFLILWMMSPSDSLLHHLNDSGVGERTGRLGLRGSLSFSLLLPRLEGRPLVDLLHRQDQLLGHLALSYGLVDDVARPELGGLPELL